MKLRIPRALLRDQIRIESPAQTPNGQGGFTTTWQPLATVQAGVHELSGREALFGAELAENVSHMIYLENVAGLVPNCEIQWGTRRLRVVSALARGDRLTLVMAEGLR